MVQGGGNVYRQPGVPPGIENYGENESGELFATSLDGTVYQVGGIGGYIHCFFQH